MLLLKNSETIRASRVRSPAARNPERRASLADCLSLLPLIRFLAPPLCPVCDREVAVTDQALGGKETEGFPGNGLCAGCRPLLATAALDSRGRCPRCFHALHAGACSFCAGRIVFFDEHHSLFGLSAGWRRLVHRWKYEQERRLFRVFLPALSRRLAEIRANERLSSVDRIVYIESGREGYALRSFQPCRDLASHVARAEGLAWGGDLCKAGNKQSSNSRLFRHIRVQNSLHAKRPPPERVLLLEDVFTTGATANEAARILKKNGAKFVRVISLLFREDLIDQG